MKLVTQQLPWRNRGVGLHDGRQRRPNSFCKCAEHSNYCNPHCHRPILRPTTIVCLNSDDESPAKGLAAPKALTGELDALVVGTYRRLSCS